MDLNSMKKKHTQYGRMLTNRSIKPKNPEGWNQTNQTKKKIIKIKKRNNKSRNREHELSSVFCGKYMCFKDNIS